MYIFLLPDCVSGVERGDAIGVREAGIGLLDPPARLLSSALVELASSVRSLSVWFRPAFRTGAERARLSVSLLRHRCAPRDTTQHLPVGTLLNQVV